ncbi:MAG: phage holin family protein [Verrucomicrobiota bacterium]
MYLAIIRWAFLSLAVLISSLIIPGIDGTLAGILVAALMLGILNVFIKPILTFISLPFIILTLGIFILIINAFLLLLTSWIVPEFHVAGFWSAIGGSLLISLVGMFFNPDKSKSRQKRKARVTRRVVINKQAPKEQPSDVPPGKGPVIDI